MVYYICNMFIRTKTSPNSPKKAVQIVENLRQGNKIKQRIVRHLGTVFDEQQELKLREIGEFIIANLETEVQPSLFSPEELAMMAIKARREKSKDDSPINVNLKNLEEEQRVILGIHEIYGEIYHQLGFDNVLGNPKRRVAISKNLFNIVMARIANPSSKRASVNYLERDFGVHLSLDGVYNMMDEIDEEAVKKIQNRAYNAAQSILPEKVNVLFYDCTTLYFESFTEDELKQNGYSKDMKFNQPQVILALLTTTEGLPIGYEVFEGSKFEGHTLANAIDKIENNFDVGEIVFVADSAMLSRQNMKLLEDRGKRYIVGARLRNMDKSTKAKITDKSNYRKLSETEWIAQFDIGDNRRLIVTYSKERAEKDRHDREEAVSKLKSKLEKSKNPASLISNYGYKKYLQVAGSSKVELNEKKLEEDQKWDGLHGMITNDEDLSAQEIISHYHSLWQIEECFRISKHDLRIRPIFHWTPRRIRAHIAICFIALTCVRHLSYRVAIQYKKLSEEQIRNDLVHVQGSVLIDKTTGKRYCIPSMPTQQIKGIYRVLGKVIDSTPYELA